MSVTDTQSTNPPGGISVCFDIPAIVKALDDFKKENWKKICQQTLEHVKAMLSTKLSKFVLSQEIYLDLWLTIGDQKIEFGSDKQISIVCDVTFDINVKMQESHTFNEEMLQTLVQNYRHTYDSFDMFQKIYTCLFVNELLKLECFKNYNIEYLLKRKL